MVAWIEQYASIIGFFVQVAFYIVVAVSALWAAITFARYVKYMTTDEEDSAEPVEEVSVEEFVE